MTGSTPTCRETGDDLAQFLELFDDEDDFFAELNAEEGHFDETGVLVAVADDQAVHLILQAKPGEHLRLAAHLQAESGKACPASRISSTTSRSWLTLMGKTPRYWPW